MTVKEIFELRKQGRIEEAYEAIRPMYAVHKGKYTTLAMFWTGSDILRKRLTEKRHTEARKVFEALLRVLPSIDDKDGKVHAAIRKSQGHPITKAISELSDRLSSAQPTTMDAQSDFYRRMAEKYGIG